MAPAVDPAALPGLDAKVDAYLRVAADRRAPVPRVRGQGHRRAHDGRRRHPPGGRDLQPAAQLPVKALQEGGLSEGSQGRRRPCSSCAAPSRTSTPSEATGAKKLLGMIPFGDKIDDYFRKYQSAQSHLDAHPARRCYDGQDELRKDNAALNLEKQQLWETMGRLNQYVYIAERLDARLVGARSPSSSATDPEKAKALREDVLFYVRQKHQDLLTQLAVSIQSYLAIDIVIKNNIELIKGVDRATTTTVSALRTAVIVAQALANQKLVLDQITALNTTTSELIERTSRDAARQLGRDPAAGGVGHDRPAAAAGRVRRTSTQTMDAIDTFKVQALDTMAATIGTLETEVGKSRRTTSSACQQQRPAGGRRLASTSA